MNILLINHYAGSLYHGMEYRTYYMAREWVRAGHKVLVVAADQSHVRSKQIEIPKNKSHLYEKIDGIEYLWLKTTKYSKNGVKRAINIFSFIIQLFRFSKIISRCIEPDVVIASSTYPLDIFPARYIAKMTEAKLVYEIHDLWPLSPIQLGPMSEYHPFILLVQFAENYCYKYSDAVISILPKVAEHVKEHGLALNKLHIVENGICLDEWENPEEISESLSRTLEEKNNGCFSILYTGQHGIANALTNFVKAAYILKKEKIVFYLAGKGPEKQNLIELAKRLKLDNLYFLDNLPKSLIASLLSKVDCLYIGLQKQPLFKYGISPNKLIDYMMSGKPIIQAIEAGNDMVKDAGCGISVPAENPEALSEAIVKMMNMSKSDREKMGKRGQDYVKKNHDYKVLGKKFLDAINFKS